MTTVTSSPDYAGGLIGFALLGTQISYSERKWNIMATGTIFFFYRKLQDPTRIPVPAPWIKCLVYQSTATPNAYYLGFEDGSCTSSSFQNDGDFNDYVFFIEGLTQTDVINTTTSTTGVDMTTTTDMSTTTTTDVLTSTTTTTSVSISTTTTDVSTSTTGFDATTTSTSSTTSSSTTSSTSSSMTTTDGDANSTDSSTVSTTGATLITTGDNSTTTDVSGYIIVDPSSERKNNAGVIVGAVIGSFLGCMLLMIVAAVWYRNNKKKAKDPVYVVELIPSK